MARMKVQPMRRPVTSWEKAPVVMTTEYTAMLLGINPTTLRHMAEKGEIPAMKCGRLWRFAKSAVQTWTEGAHNGKQTAYM